MSEIKSELSAISKSVNSLDLEEQSRSRTRY